MGKFLVKFIYSEKATKFCEIFIMDLIKMTIRTSSHGKKHDFEGKIINHFKHDRR